MSDVTSYIDLVSLGLKVAFRARIIFESLSNLLCKFEKLRVCSRLCLLLIRTDFSNKLFLLICHNSLALRLLDGAFDIQRYFDIEDILVDLKHITLIAVVDD